MTFGEGKRKVLMLIDEYSSGGSVTVDADIEVKMADFFDLAQKDMANYARIVREWTPEEQDRAENGGYMAPPAFAHAFRVWRDGVLTSRYPWKGTCILLPPDDVGRVSVEYFATPATIPQDVKDDYAFEVSEEAAACMPYFVAAQQLIVDLLVDASPLLALYDRMKAALDTRMPESGGGGIKQRLYGSAGRRKP